MARQPIPKPWLNSMRMFTIGGKINRAPSPMAARHFSPSPDKHSSEYLQELFKFMSAPPIPLIDPKLFLYSVEAIGARFSFRLWLGWFGIFMQRQWEDYSNFDWSSPTPPLRSSLTLQWGRVHNLTEGNPVHLHEKSWIRHNTPTGAN